MTDFRSLPLWCNELAPILREELEARRGCAMYLRLHRKAGGMNPQYRHEGCVAPRTGEGEKWTGCRLELLLCLCVRDSGERLFVSVWTFLGPTWEPWEDSSGGVLIQNRQEP